MGENSYFQKALSDFTFETANGGAIRHLADSGYTVRQIMEQLDFPASYERVRKAVWEHLVRQGTILLEEPGSGSRKEKVTYVREYDQYGKASFRRVVVREEEKAVVNWAVQTLDSLMGCLKTTTEGTTFMADFFVPVSNKQDENGMDYSYASFDFGVILKREPLQYEAMLSALDEHQREYVTSLPWAKQRVYHKLDSNGIGILEQLLGAGQYQGKCYFLKTRNIIEIG